MAKTRELISQLQVTHFPSGETMDSRKLEDYKLAYEQHQAKKTISMSIIIGGIVVMVIILSLIAGTLGYILGGIAFLAGVVIAIIQQNETKKDTVAAYKDLGITSSELRTAIKNLDKGMYAYTVKTPTKL